MKNYDANQVTLIIAGLIIDSGFNDGDFVTVDQDSDDFTDVVGADGEVSRARTNDNRATVKVTLMATSDGNSILSTLNNLDKSATNGAGVGPFFLRDKQGTALYSSDACWVSKPPGVAYGKEVGTREWTVRIANLSRYDGGS